MCRTIRGEPRDGVTGEEFCDRFAERCFGSARYGLMGATGGSPQREAKSLHLGHPRPDRIYHSCISSGINTCSNGTRVSRLPAGLVAIPLLLMVGLYLPQVLVRCTCQRKMVACGYIIAQGPQQTSATGSPVICIVAEASGTTVYLMREENS